MYFCFNINPQGECDMVECDVNERIDMFLKDKTYTFIKLISGSIFNGIISSKDNDIIEFKDDKLGKIPILIKEIDIISYSNKKQGDALGTSR